ncbi:MAG: hypothetical protein WC753_03755 [Candidatus Gracilibacteria bacterium]
MATIDTNPNQNILDQKPNPTDSYQAERDKDVLKNELQKWSKGEDKEKAREIDKVVKDIVASPRSPAELEDILSKLPIDKRFIVEKMILDEQKHQIAMMSQEKYKQYLQAQFPSGVPANISEMALAMVTDTSEMYKTAQKEIEKTTAGENPSEITKNELKTDQRTAIAATQGAEEKTKNITNEIGHIT